jgi:uncharacterized membrane protein YsdA (DUF1294 family)
MNNGLIILFLGLGVVNLIGFILVGVDKKRSVGNEERIREVYLFFVAVFFASLGVFLGMFYFRNKTRKLYFPLGIGLLMLEQAALLYLLTRNL